MELKDQEIYGFLPRYFSLSQTTLELQVFVIVVTVVFAYHWKGGDGETKEPLVIPKRFIKITIRLLLNIN